MQSEQLIADALKRIRESEELGLGSCSTIDECYTDTEMVERIQDFLLENPIATVEDVFKEFCEIERIVSSVMKEREDEGW